MLNYKLIESNIIIENHPYEPFLNENTKYLIVGTIPPHEFCNKKSSEKVFWYYCSEKNDFWNIMGFAFNQLIENSSTKLLKEWSLIHHIGFIDLFHNVIRHNLSSSDSDIIPTAYRDIFEIIERYLNIEAILFTSSYVERLATKLFNKKYNKYVNRKDILFPTIKIDNKENEIKWILLKSPSRRNTDDIEDKKNEWKKIFDELKKEST